MTRPNAGVRTRALRGDGSALALPPYIETDRGGGRLFRLSQGCRIATGTEAAFLRVDPAGTVTATFSVAPQGQGHETALAQVVADALGVSLDSVRVMCGDTALAPAGDGHVCQP